MRLIICFIVILSLISNINAQSSPTFCSYNGIDYGYLGNSTEYSSTDSGNQYTYYFNLCKISQKCNTYGTGNVVACQIKNVANSQATAIGIIGQGTFSSSNGDVLLNYKTSSNPCSGGVYRSFNIHLIPASINNTQISQIEEESKCTYGVQFRYPSNNHGSSSSDNINSSSGNNNNNGKIICENSNTGLNIQSYTNISCKSYGPTYCINDDGSTCETNQYNGEINCGVNSNGNNTMSCTSSNISCSSGGMICSIQLNKLMVNGKQTDEKIVVIGGSDSNSSDGISISYSFTLILLLFLVLLSL